jgi:hypothetical protein
LAFNEFIIIDATNNTGTISLSASAVKETDLYQFEGLRFGIYKVEARHTSPHFIIEPVPLENITITPDGFILIVDKDYEGIDFDLEEIYYRIAGTIEGQISRFDTTDTATISVSGTTDTGDIFTDTVEFSESFAPLKSFRWTKPGLVRQGDYVIKMTWPSLEYRYDISPPHIATTVQANSVDHLFTVTPKEYTLDINVTGHIEVPSDLKFRLKGNPLEKEVDNIYETSFTYPVANNTTKGSALPFVPGSYAQTQIKVNAFPYSLELIVPDAKFEVSQDPKVPNFDVQGDMSFTFTVMLKTYAISGSIGGDNNELNVTPSDIKLLSDKFPVTVEIDGLDKTYHEEVQNGTDGTYKKEDVPYGDYKVKVKTPEDIDSPLR